MSEKQFIQCSPWFQSNSAYSAEQKCSLGNFVGELLGTVVTACFTLKIMEEEGDEAVTEVKKN